MSCETNEGKWYVPKDLGIVKATEEQGGTYYRVKGEDGKEKWIPAKVFKRKYQDMDKTFIDDVKIMLAVDFCVAKRPDSISEKEFEYFKKVLAHFGKNLMRAIFELVRVRKENEDVQAD